MDPSGHGFGADPDLFLKVNDQKQKTKTKNRPLNTDYLCYPTRKNKTTRQKRTPREERAQRRLLLFHFIWQWHIETILAGMRLGHFPPDFVVLRNGPPVPGVCPSSAREKWRGVVETREIIPKYKQRLWKTHPATSVPVCGSASQSFFRNYSATRTLAWKLISFSIPSS